MMQRNRLSEPGSQRRFLTRSVPLEALTAFSRPSWPLVALSLWLASSQFAWPAPAPPSVARVAADRCQAFHLQATLSESADPSLAPALGCKRPRASSLPPLTPRH